MLKCKDRATRSATRTAQTKPASSCAGRRCRCFSDAWSMLCRAAVGCGLRELSAERASLSSWACSTRLSCSSSSTCLGVGLGVPGTSWAHAGAPPPHIHHHRNTRPVLFTIFESCRCDANRDTLLQVGVLPRLAG